MEVSASELRQAMLHVQRGLARTPQPAYRWFASLTPDYVIGQDRHDDEVRVAWRFTDDHGQRFGLAMTLDPFLWQIVIAEYVFEILASYEMTRVGDTLWIRTAASDADDHKARYARLI